MYVQKKQIQIIFSSKNISEIYKIQTKLQKIGLTSSVETTTDLIIRYEIFPKSLTKEQVRFFEEYWKTREQIRLDIRDQIFQTAHELDVMEA